jgi:hypothetical protein
VSTCGTADVVGLPAEFDHLGPPDAVFPAKAFGETNAGIALLLGGVLMLASGAGAIYGYSNVKFPKDGPPAEIVLGVGGFALTAGFILIAVMLRQPRSRGDANAFRGYIAFPSALVRCKDGRSEIFPWDEIEALINPETAMGDFLIQAHDGRKIPVDRAIVGYMDLLGTILNRLRGPLLSQAQKRLESGQTVEFGPFGLSRGAIEHKGKSLRWDQISELDVGIYQGHRRLRIKSRGAIWPWCFALLYGIPNETIFLKLIGDLRLEGRAF